MTRILITLLLSIRLYAHDFGVHGVLFPIHEDDLLELIKQRLTLSEVQTKWQESIRSQAERPKAVSDLARATAYRCFHWDPTFVLGKDVHDQEGNVLFTKGTSTNPLTLISLSRSLLFFDGDDPNQVRWARNQTSTTDWILVRGSPPKLESIEHRPVYFDQFGVMIRKFGIKAIPARVTQDGLTLKIEELPLKEAT